MSTIVVSVHKKGDEINSNVDNYRRISPASLVMKVMEKMIIAMSFI